MSKPELEQITWDFSSCLEQERSTCLHYEYAREFVHGRPDMIINLVTFPRPQPFGNRLVFMQSKEGIPDNLPLIYSGFPVTPWLGIPKEEREKLIALCKPLPEENAADPDLLVRDDFDLSLLQQLRKTRDELAAAWKQKKSERQEGSVADRKVDSDSEEQDVEYPSACRGPKHYYSISDEMAYAVIKLDWT